ncbi:MAG: thioredoxin family protein [Bacteroidetes bacterium]|nr:thioredoxin family protein [Bacteroidota bacterium]
MNYILVTLLFIFGTSIAQTQDWETNFDKALTQANSNDQPIILVFKGSDWCAPCIKLDQQVFETDTFKLYAKDHFVMLEADFPRRKKNALTPAQQEHNNHLAEKYNPNGIFPFVVIIDKTGKVMGETGYFKSTPSEYILHLESFKG